MASRYDYMKEGVVADEVTGSLYPDPLSLNYLNLELSSIPEKEKMNDVKTMYFWSVARDHYGMPAYDDIVLTLNGVEHINLIKTNDEIFFPSLEDINSSFALNR